MIRVNTKAHTPHVASIASVKSKSKLTAAEKSKLTAVEKSKLTAAEKSKLTAAEKSRLTAAEKSRLPAAEKKKHTTNCTKHTQVKLTHNALCLTSGRTYFFGRRFQGWWEAV